MLSSLWQSLRGISSHRRWRATPACSNRQRFRPELCLLEDRVALSATTFMTESPFDHSTLASAQTLPTDAGPIAVVGSINPVGTLDEYALSLPAGATLWAYVDTGGPQNAGATSRDSELNLYNHTGNVILANNDDGATGNGGDASIETPLSSALAYTSTSNGTYYLEVRKHNNNGIINPYTLYLNVTTHTPAPENEAGAGNDTLATADTLDAQSTPRSGVLIASDDNFRFDARAGDRVWVQVSADGETLATEPFTVTFYDPNQNQILQTATVDSGQSSQAFSFNVPLTGTYYVGLHSTDTTQANRGYSILVSGNTTQPSPSPTTGPADTTPPTVIGALPIRTGKAGKVTELDVQFSEALDAIRATANPGAFVVLVKRKGSPKMRQVTPQAVIYDPSTHTLRLMVAFKKQDQTVKLTIKAGTVADPLGNVLAADLVLTFNVAAKKH
jgi:hypothetical protein